MKKLTTPKAILIGFFMVAVSIASLPYEGFIIKTAHAELSGYDLTGIESSLDNIANSIHYLANVISTK